MPLVHTLRRVFPTGTLSMCNPKAGFQFEVELPCGAMPENCAVVLHATDPNARPAERREHFLVQADEFLLHFCIRPGAGLDADRETAASVGGAALDDDEAVAELKARARQMLQLQSA
jgi:hypothetical protein